MHQRIAKPSFNQKISTQGNSSQNQLMHLGTRFGDADFANVVQKMGNDNQATEGQTIPLAVQARMAETFDHPKPVVTEAPQKPVIQGVLNHINNTEEENNPLPQMVQAIRAQSPAVEAMLANQGITVNLTYDDGENLHGHTAFAPEEDNQAFIDQLRNGTGVINITVNDQGDAVETRQTLLHELMIHALPIQSRLANSRQVLTRQDVTERAQAILAAEQEDEDMTLNDATLDALEEFGIDFAGLMVADGDEHHDGASWHALVNTARLIAAGVQGQDANLAQEILYAAVDDAILHLPANSEFRNVLLEQFYDDDDSD